ncbi:MAG: protein kinase domain-containing protein [Gemmataceae bacterium]
MAVPSTTQELLELIRKSGVVDDKRLNPYVEQLRAANALPDEPGKCAGYLVRDGFLTHFQAEQFLLGKWRRFTIGKYKVLERLGSGGMGSVYLCEHKFMRRRVAVKVLPAAKAEDPSSLERFYREARAAAALDHPNIVRAYDIDQDENLHFLVMEYVDGSSLQEIVKKHGPMDVLRACHYIRQAAFGLQHAHEAGLVHRDIKPGNLLVDRTGVLKILDMGLARFFNDQEDILTKKYDESVLGTADYLAPEQAIDSHGVDIRADIYSLGATFYFMLTGQPPFSEGTVAQKLIWHQTRQPKPIRALRPDVPEGLAAFLEHMMAKNAAERFQIPIEVAEGLAPWTQQPIPPPPEAEMPRLSPAAMMAGPEAQGPAISTAASSGAAPANYPRTAPAGVASRPASGPPVTRADSPSATPTMPKAPMVPPSAPASPRPLPSKAPPKKPIVENNGLSSLASAFNKAPVSEDRGGAGLAELTNLDTTGSSSSPSSGAQAGAGALTAQDRRRLWIVLGAAGLLFLASVLGLTIWALSGGSPTTPTATTTEPPRQPQRWSVGKDQPIKSVRAALSQAQANDTIVLMDDVHEEQLVITQASASNLSRNITIHADPAKNGSLVWRAPVKLSQGDKLIELPGVTGWRFEGMTFDGAQRVSDLITLFGKCPGVTFENVQLQGFTQSGVQIMNCVGESDKPIVFRQVRIVNANNAPGAQPPSNAISFDVNPGIRDVPMNAFVEVRQCQFIGPFRNAIVNLGGDNKFSQRSSFTLLRDGVFQGNRFFNASVGFLYNNGKLPAPHIQARIEANTFCQVANTFSFKPLPTDQSKLELINNLFANGVNNLAQTTGAPDVNAIKQIFVLDGNVRENAVKEGNINLGIRGIAFPPLPTNKDAADFLTYPANSPLTTAGVNGGPVGYQPGS